MHVAFDYINKGVKLYGKLDINTYAAVFSDKCTLQIDYISIKKEKCETLENVNTKAYFAIFPDGCLQLF
jgi:hypothetical protein